MTTLEMETAVMRYFKPRQNCVVPNVSWGMGFRHELDVLVVSKQGIGTEIEIKISKADLLKDKEKKHGHIDPMNRIRRLYFAVPEKLKDAALKEIPDRSGLLVVREHNYALYCVEARPAKQNMTSRKFTDQEIKDLYRLGSLRILGLKQKISELTRKLKTQ